MNEEIPLYYLDTYMQAYNDPALFDRQLTSDVEHGHITAVDRERMLEEAAKVQVYIYRYTSKINGCIVVGIYRELIPTTNPRLSPYGYAIINSFTSILQTIVKDIHVDIDKLIHSHWLVYLCESVFTSILRVYTHSESTYSIDKECFTISHRTMYATSCISVISTRDAFVPPELDEHMGTVNARLTDFFTRSENHGRCITEPEFLWAIAAVRVNKTQRVAVRDMVEVLSTHLHELLHYVSRLLRSYENAETSVDLFAVWGCHVHGFVYHSLTDHLRHWTLDPPTDPVPVFEGEITELVSDDS